MHLNCWLEWDHKFHFHFNFNHCLMKLWINCSLVKLHFGFLCRWIQLSLSHKKLSQIKISTFSFLVGVVKGIFMINLKMLVMKKMRVDNVRKGENEKECIWECAPLNGGQEKGREKVVVDLKRSFKRERHLITYVK